MTKSPWYVYLLQCADGSLYCGITTNLQRRLDEHNGLLRGGAKYTRGRRPVTMLASVSRPDKGSALKLEKRIQSIHRSKKLETILAEDMESTEGAAVEENREGFSGFGEFSGTA